MRGARAKGQRMPKTANHIKLDMNGEGYVAFATITSDPLTSVRASVTEVIDGESKVTEDSHEYNRTPSQKWTAAATDSAAYSLRSEGTIVVNGVTIADRVSARVAKHAGDAVTAEIMELNAVAPRPQSAREVREDLVADIMSQGLSQEDLIAALTSLAIG